MSETIGSYPLLETIGSPDDMKSLNPEQLLQLFGNPDAEWIFHESDEDMIV